MKMRKLLALLTAVLLMMQLPLSALAATYYLTDGSVYITTSSGRGQVVKQGSSEWEDLAPVISSNGVETGNTIEVTTNDGVNANVTLKDVNINNTNGAGMLVDRAEGTTVTVELDGENSLTGASKYAGLQTAGDGILIIEDANNDGGALIAQGGDIAAGIGGGVMEDGENITINGGKITACAGNYEAEWQGSGAAGIGGGDAGDGNNIVINGGTVDAFGSCFAAGIGGGTNGDANNIEINGGEVNADGGNAGAGIGGGSGGYATNVSVSGDANVTAIGSYGAANIGNGTTINGTEIPDDQKNLLDEEGNWKDNVDTSGLYNTGNVTMGEGDDAETIVGTVPDPNAPVAAAPVYYGEYCYGGPGTWSATSHEVDEPFWQDVVAQLRAAEKGKAVLINVGDRKVMPAYVMEAVRETGITLIIQWDGGDDIIIEKAYPYKDAYQVYWLQNLNRILASVK